MPRVCCERCQRPQAFCLCSLIPHLPNRTRVLILQHPDEQKHALNTARLVALGLRNVQLEIGEQFADLAKWLAVPGYCPHLLFPGDGAQPLLSRGLDQPPMLLVVPDGTWRKARKLLYLNPLLADLPKVTLGQMQASRYRLRKAPAEGALSTLEAVTYALETLEQQSYEPLLKPFDALIEQQIQAMGAQTYARNYLKTSATPRS